jgi:hypothetical protein
MLSVGGKEKDRFDLVVGNRRVEVGQGSNLLRFAEGCEELVVEVVGGDEGTDCFICDWPQTPRPTMATRMGSSGMEDSKRRLKIRD